RLEEARFALEHLAEAESEGYDDPYVAMLRRDASAALERCPSHEYALQLCERFLRERNLAAAKFRDAVWQAHHQLSAAERGGWKLVPATVNLLRDQLLAAERLCEEYGAPERKVWR